MDNTPFPEPRFSATRRIARSLRSIFRRSGSAVAAARPSEHAEIHRPNHADGSAVNLRRADLGLRALACCLDCAVAPARIPRSDPQARIERPNALVGRIAIEAPRVSPIPTSAPKDPTVRHAESSLPGTRVEAVPRSRIRCHAPARHGLPVERSSARLARARAVGLLTSARAHPASARGAFRPIAARPRVLRMPERILSELTLTRRKAPALNDAEFTREKRLLAAVSGIPESSLHWIGLFRNVPIAAAESLDLDEKRGILAIALKPNPAAILRAQRVPTPHLAFGRDRKTGAIVHAAI